MASLRAAFRIAADAEISIEVDPRTVDAARLRHLRELGFNRLSFGVQDFDPDVQKAVHRVQSYEHGRDADASARALGFVSINVDLIYGLPHQTRSRSRAPSARSRPAPGPHRALRLRAPAAALQAAAAHRMPADLPQPEDKIGMLGAAIDGFVGQGYATSAWTTSPCPTTPRRGAAPGPPAPQLPGLQHAGRLRPDRPRRVVHRPRRLTY